MINQNRIKQAINLYSNYTNGSSSFLSQFQPYFSISQISGNTTIPIGSTRSNHPNELNIAVSSYKIERFDNTMQFARCEIVYILQRQYLTNNVIKKILQIENNYKITFGVKKPGGLNVEHVVASIQNFDVSIENDIVKLTVTYTNQLKNFFDYNSTVNLGGELNKRLSTLNQDKPYYTLKQFMSTLQDILKDKIKFDVVYADVKQGSAVSYKGTDLTLTNSGGYPIIKNELTKRLLSTPGMTLSSLFSDHQLMSYFFTEELLVEYLDDLKIQISIKSNQTYDADRGEGGNEVVVFKYGTKGSVFENVTFGTSSYDGLFMNQQIINSLTENYKKINGLEYYNEGLKTELVENRALLSSIKTNETQILEQLASRYNMSIDQIRLVGKQVEETPNLEWKLSYMSCSMSFNVPLLYLRVGDVFELRGLVQSYLGSSRVLYYIKSLTYQATENNMITTNIDGGLIDYLN